MNEKLEKTQILNYINILRAFAIILIVAGHTIVFGNLSKCVLSVTMHEIFSSGTTLFIFISGFLFQYLSNKYEYKKYMKKKLTNVISPYIITSVVGITLCICIPELYRNTLSGIKPIILQVIALLTTGYVHNRPTWYIPMIFLFFCCATPLLYLEKKDILYKMLPILLLITCITQRLWGYVSFNNDWTYLQKYSCYVAFFAINFIHYLSIYVLGMFFSKNREEIDTLYKNRYLLFIFMILSSVLSIYLNLKYNFLNGDISKLFLTLFLLGVFKHYDTQILNCTIINKIANCIAEYSFGIFFVHWYYKCLIGFVFSLQFPILKSSVFLQYDNLLLAFSLVLLKFILVLFMSILTIYIIKQIKRKNTRYIIGA